ncbi:SagB family peptide dehydrogenase [Ktedonospora formicarum]|nr:SagB family peptide dehydrogenase [Ktedonospora formicarum]
MNVTTQSECISYRLQENVEIRESGDGVVMTSPHCQITLPHLSPGQLRVMIMLTTTACSMQQINESLIEAHEENMLATFYRYLSCLMRHQMLFICAESGDQNRPLATLIAISSHFQQRWVAIQRDQAYRMSRFAYVRRDEDGCNYIESPLSHARIRLDHAVAACVVYHLSNAVTPIELAQTLPGEDSNTVTGLLALLVMANFVSPTTHEGRLSEEDDETCMQWDFHDLLFHSRSRIGRHDNMVGGTYRFLHRIPPLPAVKQTQWPVTLPLPQPDRERIRQVDPGLTAVMDARASIREYDNNPVTVAQLGEFLYRVARVKEVHQNGETGDITKRPYPCSGAAYEIEFYLTIDRCEGLTPGFYWYDPLNHALSFIREANQDTENMLSEASRSAGGHSRPQILINLAARFQRVSWKYQSIAYALTLKNVGVIYSTMYLVATAMNLAPCALGAGDSDRFTKLSGTDYLKETSVGEFLLGSKPVK